MKVNIGRYKKNGSARNINVQIDTWDTWNLDHTLAVIIAPALKQYKAISQSYCGDFATQEEWNAILDKMIFAFETLANSDWEKQFHSGTMDMKFVPIDADGNEVDKKDAVMYRQEKGPNYTHVFDDAGWKAYNEKIQEGLNLFGKYYRSLWD
jgi:hypothetical protein